MLSPVLYTLDKKQSAQMIEELVNQKELARNWNCWYSGSQGRVGLNVEGSDILNWNFLSKQAQHATNNMSNNNDNAMWKPLIF